MAKELHIAISAEKLFNVGEFGIANTLFTGILVSLVLGLFFLYARTRITDTNKPTGVQNFLEMIVESLLGLVESVAGKGKKADAFLPLVAGFFVFILVNNWVGLLPGFHTIKFTGEPGVHLVNVPTWMQTTAPQAFAATAPEANEEEALEQQETAEGEVLSGEAADAHEEETTKEEHHAVDLFRGANADVNMTIALALISVTATQFFGIKFAGLAYFKKFINFSSPINFFIGLLELVAEFSKIISFAFRLFGNIFAGEVLVSVIKFLIPLLIPIPFMGFEIFVGALQAYVFAMLSLVFFNMAASDHH
jgi:F-type H+-transporting ATPase subunit a